MSTSRRCRPVRFDELDLQQSPRRSQTYRGQGTVFQGKILVLWLRLVKKYSVNSHWLYSCPLPFHHEGIPTWNGLQCPVPGMPSLTLMPSLDRCNSLKYIPLPFLQRFKYSPPEVGMGPGWDGEALPCRGDSSNCFLQKWKDSRAFMPYLVSFKLKNVRQSCLYLLLTGELLQFVFGPGWSSYQLLPWLAASL